MEKPLKVFWNGKRLKDIYPHASRWQVFKFRMKRFFRKVFITISVAVAVAVIFQLGGIFNPQVSIVQADQPIPTVMKRIAGCESQGNAKLKGTQFDKNGQVLMRSNTNKSVDVGKYQINTVWFAKATELGLDVTTEQGNEDMALWIYSNKGTGDWSSSYNCWK